MSAGVGLVGAGNISTQYLDSLTRFPDVEVHFIADLDAERARALAGAYGIAAHGTVAELRVACAADTVLGVGIQNALRAMARGDIGTPLTASTMFHVPGPESWHPGPDFLYAKGAGPLLDMGPYYLTTLVHVFGAASRVHAVGSRARDTRVIGSGPRAGESFPVEVPTHVAALIEFAGGGSAQSTFSFEHALPRAGVVEINGTEGTLVLPDPNMFTGDSLLYRYGAEEPSRWPRPRASTAAEPASWTWCARCGPGRTSGPPARWPRTCWT